MLAIIENPPDALLQHSGFRALMNKWTESAQEEDSEWDLEGWRKAQLLEEIKSDKEQIIAVGHSLLHSPHSGAFGILEDRANLLFAATLIAVSVVGGFGVGSLISTLGQPTKDTQRPPPLRQIQEEAERQRLVPDREEVAPVIPSR